MPFRYRLREEQVNRICEFLLTSHGKPFCDECLRQVLKFTRTMVPERSLSENAAKRGFVREKGICGRCHKALMTTRAIVSKDRNPAN